MRFVEVTIPTGKREAVLGVLEDEGVDYTLTDETSNREYTAVVTFPLPRQAVEPVLDRLREVNVAEESLVVVMDAETVVSRRFEELQERYRGEADRERIAREELRARTGDLSPSLPGYVLLTVVSVVVATAGLLLDSPAIVVGSMVIAPLIGPPMATSVGTVLDDRDLFVEGLRLQALGLVVAVAAAAAFALLVKTTLLVPPGLDVLSIDEVARRVTADFLSLVVALGAGVAGAYSLRSGVSTALVGVMIAVALVPPAAVVGIGVAWGLPTVAVGAGILALVNALSINLAALATFWYSGYRPERWFRRDEARAATVKRVAVLLAAIAVLSVVLGGATLGTYRTAVTDQTVRTAVEDVVGSSEYANLSVVDVSVEHGDRGLRHPFAPPVTEVVVTVGRPPGETYPDLPAALHDRLTEVEEDVTVEVRYVDVAVAGRSVAAGRWRPVGGFATATAGRPGAARTSPASVKAAFHPSWRTCWRAS